MNGEVIVPFASKLPYCMMMRTETMKLVNQPSMDVVQSTLSVMKRFVKISTKSSDKSRVFTEDCERR